MTYVLGLDISTTASKALLVGTGGRIAGSSSAAHSHSIPHPLWSEQDVEEWWAAARRAVSELMRTTGVPGAAVRAVGLTGQMHGLVLLGSGGEVLRPAILWNDGRSQEQCAAIRRRVGLARLVATAGNDAFAGFAAPKLLWVREHEPEIYRRVRQVMLPKDYVRYRLTGVFATDKAGAGGTLLLNLTTRDWSEALLTALDVPVSWLPPTFEGPEVTGVVSASGAAATGLLAGTPVVAGGGDQAAQAVGVGAIAPGIWALTLGTSGVVFAPSDKPRTDALGRAHAFPHAVPECWHLMGVMLAAGGSLAWYHDTMCPQMTYEAMSAEAAGVQAGSDGLVFLPYLSGERTPHADPLATGAFVGLTARHTRGHMTRAVLEGVAYGLRDNLLLLQEAGLTPPEELRVSGGGATSRLWRQILADVLQVSLRPVMETEGAALGAALLAGVGAGYWDSAQAACDAAITTAEATVPRTAFAAYSEMHAHFAALYGQLKPFFHR